MSYRDDQTRTERVPFANVRPPTPSGSISAESLRALLDGVALADPNDAPLGALYDLIDACRKNAALMSREELINLAALAIVCAQCCD